MLLSGRVKLKQITFEKTGAMENRTVGPGGLACHVSGQGPRRFTTCDLVPLLPSRLTIHVFSSTRRVKTL